MKRACEGTRVPIWGAVAPATTAMDLRSFAGRAEKTFSAGAAFRPSFRFGAVNAAQAAAIRRRVAAKALHRDRISAPLGSTFRIRSQMVKHGGSWAHGPIVAKAAAVIAGASVRRAGGSRCSAAAGRAIEGRDGVRDAWASHAVPFDHCAAGSLLRRRLRCSSRPPLAPAFAFELFGRKFFEANDDEEVAVVPDAQPYTLDFTVAGADKDLDRGDPQRLRRSRARRSGRRRRHGRADRAGARRLRAHPRGALCATAAMAGRSTSWSTAQPVETLRPDVDAARPGAGQRHRRSRAALPLRRRSASTGCRTRR